MRLAAMDPDPPAPRVFWSVSGTMSPLVTDKFPPSARFVSGSAVTTAVIAVVAVTALYFGREVLVPITLALLLSFVLAPPVRFLQGWYVPRIIAVTFVVVVAFAAILSFGALMVGQVNQLAGELPAYQSTLREKIQSLRGAAGATATLDRASEVLQDLGKEIDQPNARPPSGSLKPGTPAAKPIPVEVRQPDPGALRTLVALITPLLHPLTTAGIVILFVFFILMQRQDLRNRLVRLAGAHDLQRTTAALDDAGQRLSRLFLMQLALNAGFGLVIGAGLWLIGVPSAPLWGMLAMILRFVPYVGAVIAAIFPLALAAAVGPGWSMVLMTLALFVIVEPLVGHVIEPIAAGKSSGLSPVAVIASATFWTWLWGPIGLILATPLTLCLVVLGRHVDRFKFLEVMFSDRPPLTPPELVYQRMLARDPVEAAEQAQAFLKEKPLAAYYDEILLEGLKLAQADAERGLLDEERMQRIRDAAAEIVDDLSAHQDEAPSEKPPTGDLEEPTPLQKLSEAETPELATALPERWRTGKPVLCIPGLGLLDEAAAMALAQLVEREGIGARVVEAGALSMSKMFSWETQDVELICLCYVQSATSAQIRYAIRRLRRRAPDVLIIVALFGDNDRFEEPAKEANIDFMQSSLRATVDKIVEAARSAEESDTVPEPLRAGVTV